MRCSIHENYGAAEDTFEIVEPRPSIPAEQLALLLKEHLKEHTAITDIEVASLALPALEGEPPKIIDRIMVNINPLHVVTGTDFNQVINGAADAAFMSQAGL